MIDDTDAGRLKFLIKKRRAFLITPEETEELVVILNNVAKDADLPVGLRATAGIVLASTIGKQKLKELTA